MRVLDLFSGLGGWSQAFKDRGHSVTTVDIEPKFKPTICEDIMNLKVIGREIITPDLLFYGQFDIVLASPPCNCFSIASVYRHWNKDKTPKDEETRDSIKLIGHTIELILNLQPRFWILENPRGMLRNVLGKPSVTTYWASWQDDEERRETIKGFHDKRKPCLKPTDLWGVLPEGVDFSKPSEWIKASRGATLGTQGIRDSAIRAKIPYGLSLAVCIACEKELQVRRTK